MAGLRDWITIPEKFKNLLTMPVQLVMNIVAMPAFALMWYVAFTNWSPAAGDWWEAQFILFNNFIKLASDQYFIDAILRTLLIVGICVPIEFALGFLLAYVLSGDFIGKKVAITIILVPMMVVPAVGGYIFYLMFLEYGPVNALLSIVTGTDFRIAWFNQPNTALISIMLTDIWQWTPFMFLIFISSMLALPQDPINAAYVLGASRGYTFRRVMLPMLKTPIMIALILRSIEAFKIFDYIYIMTRGGPGYTTQTISMYLYEWGFKYIRFGYVTSASVIIFLTMVIIGWYASKPLRGVK
ncbi:carbohydrate ABC transporter permease [[Eubacterium] cellulosolvens]